MALLYKDPTQPIETRVEDLLQRMTLEERVGQMLQLDGRVEPIKNLQEKHAGSFLQILGKDTDPLIRAAAETRLGIPLLLGVDAIHGHSFWRGATIFPTQLAMACTWNEKLIEETAAVTAREMRGTGVSWTFSPVLCLTRDLRWGRVGETFGEDPLLIGRFATAMIRGYQGDDPSDPNRVLATAKHYAGYSETQGGRDASEADLSQRKLRSYFLPPFEKTTDAAAYMTGYQSIEGLPSTANQWLLREVLKKEWGYKGFLVTDWENVTSMVTKQKICANAMEAAALAVRCGNDMMMASPEFYQGALDAVAAGLLDEALIDDSVRRILRAKFRLGLFENNRPYDAASTASIGCEAHHDVVLQAARESLVLLKNDGLLPLNESSIKRIAVIGPNADDDFTQLGDWSLGTGQAGGKGNFHPRECTTTVLDGIKARFAGDVVYAKGCGIMPDETGDLEEAVAVAEYADVAVVVVGDSRHLIGEFHSTATLELQGGQNELIERVAATGTPMIVVMINSKPLILPKVGNEAAAIIEQFNPGMLGGQALAETLFGDFNPSGRLTVSFPYHVGQQPIFYSQVRGQHGDRYADMTQEPLYAFGEGLSYTRFEYSEPRLEKTTLGMDDTLAVEIDITNTGDRDGIETVQAYVSDLVTSATWVDKELKAYARVDVAKDATETVRLEIPASECSIVNAYGERVVEPGDFELRIGPSSRESVLKRISFTVTP
jgi:beta-glucosidase